MDRNAKLHLFLQEKCGQTVSLIPALHKAREIFGEITVDVERTIAEGLDLPFSRVEAAATFFSAFNGMDDGDANDAFLRSTADPSRPAWLLEHPTGYIAARKVIEENIDMIALLRAGKVRGKSGSGFPVADKWELTRNTESDLKYIVCNGSEGEGDTYKDYVLLCKKPELVIEGMVICALTTGIEQGFLYVRAEYEKAYKTVKAAIATAYEQGVLGVNVLGTGKRFDLEAVLGGGAYVSGEETGLLAVLEGGRSEPRLKPPYPGVCGLYGKPTIINNVESFAAAANIVLHGAEAFLEMGTPDAGGTKLFTVSGCVECPGVYELPHHVTPREVLSAAGGPKDGEPIKGFQIGGGATGSFGGREHLDVTLDYGSLKAVGLSLGTAAIRFIGASESVPRLALLSTAFLKDQSCGMCTACRYGLSDLTDCLRRICDGTGKGKTLEQAKAFCGYIGQNARCALGQAAPTALLTALRQFPEEFEALCGKENSCEYYPL